ncbi:MAG: hypothetical protein ACR2IF_12985 [Terriglobales bacterium]
MVSAFWKRVDFGWVWTWMAVYGCSLTILALYLASTFTAAAAQVVSDK